MTARLRNRLLVGDARQTLQSGAIAPSSIDMLLTSPPYFRLRDYGVPGQLGLEADVDQWADHLVAVVGAARPLLVPTGSLWLNLGDCYSVRAGQGARPGSLLLAPERLALRLLASGWRLRNKLIWQKPNPLPTPVRDRLNATYEVIYIFVQSPGYYFDLDALRVPHQTARRSPAGRRPQVNVQPSLPMTRRPATWHSTNSASRGGLSDLRARGIVGHPLGKNPGDVWCLPSARGRGDHHAAFPQTLAERAIVAGTPERRCVVCRRPYRRAVIRAVGGTAVRGVLSPGCTCHAGSEPGLVLDPFMGTGTTAVAAERLGRDWLGVELNPDVAGAATERIEAARAGPTSAA